MGLELYSLKKKCFHQGIQSWSIFLEPDTFTWPFKSPHAIETIRKERGPILNEVIDLNNKGKFEFWLLNCDQETYRDAYWYFLSQELWSTETVMTQQKQDYHGLRSCTIISPCKELHTVEVLAEVK